MRGHKQLPYNMFASGEPETFVNLLRAINRKLSILDNTLAIKYKATAISSCYMLRNRIISFVAKELPVTVSLT